MTREARKARTRRALLDAALSLLEGERSFSSLSLREVTRDAGVVPAAFYRHFSDMEQLGLALVDDSIAELRSLLREVLAGPQPPSNLVRAAVRTFIAYVLDHRPHFRFIAKERYSGSSTLRLAIRHEIDTFISEIARDVVAPFGADDWPEEELLDVARLFVGVVVGAIEEVLDIPAGDDDALAALHRRTERQMLIVAIGSFGWQPRAATQPGLTPPSER